MADERPRLLLLLPTTTYRTQDFLDAARTLGVDIVCASERPSTLEARLPDHFLIRSTSRIPPRAAAPPRTSAGTHPLRAVVGVDDARPRSPPPPSPSVSGSPTSAVAAAGAARDKFQMRRVCARRACPCRGYRPIALDDDPFTRRARCGAFPASSSPCRSRRAAGSIRADDRAQFVAAFQRIAAPC